MVLSGDNPVELPLRMRARYEWARWINEIGDWRSFSTITFRDISTETAHRTGWNKIGVNYARKWLGQFVSAFPEKDNSQKWFGAMEFQKWRGAVHWHVLHESFPDNWNDIKEFMWDRVGWCRIRPVVKSWYNCAYISKYCTKEDSRYEFSHELYECLVARKPESYNEYRERISDGKTIPLFKPRCLHSDVDRCWDDGKLGSLLVGLYKAEP